MNHLEETILTRLERLKADRERYISEANQTIAAFNGSIGVLEDILKADSEPPSEIDHAAQKQGGGEAPLSNQNGDGEVSVPVPNREKIEGW